MAEEFSHIYIFNLRGNQRTQGETSRREGGKIFDSGSRTPVAISILVKGGKDNTSSQGKAQIFYYDIGDYLDRERKLNEIKAFKSIEGIEKQNKFIQIKPNKDYDWINQRDCSYLEFVPMGDSKNKLKALPKKDNKIVALEIFEIFSQGVITGKDTWSFNFSKENLAENIALCIQTYNEEREKLANDKNHILLNDLSKITWGGSLKDRVKANRILEFGKDKIRECLYRPFNKQFLYYDNGFNHSHCQMDKIYPFDNNAKCINGDFDNVMICLNDRGSNEFFNAFISNQIIERHFVKNAQAFPLYYYEKIEADSKDEQSLPFQELANNSCDEKESVAIYRRKDAIRTEALDFVRGLYKDESISKEDIFYYIYALLNHKIYKEKYKDNLSKMLPRIPFAKDFKAFVKFGKELASLHLNYENYSDESPCIVGEKSKIKDFKQDNLFYSKEQTKEFLESLSDEDYAISKMKYLIKGKKDVILFNEKIAISNIPLKAYEYVVNGRSAIEWVMERYATKKDKDSGIENNPNLYECTNGALSGLKGGKYALHLLLSVIDMSVKSVKLIEKISELSIENMKLE